MIGRFHARRKRHSNSCRDIRVSSVPYHRTNRWNLFYGSLDDEYFTQQVGHAALPINGKIRSPKQDDSEINRPNQGYGQRSYTSRCNDSYVKGYATRLGKTGQEKPRGCEAGLNLHPEHEEAYLSDLLAVAKENLDLNKQIAESTHVAALCAVEILDFLKECREEF